MKIHRLNSPKRHFIFASVMFAIIAVMAFEIVGLPRFSNHANAQGLPQITVTPNISGQTFSGTIPYPSITAPGASECVPSVLWDGNGDIPDQTGYINTTQFLNGQHTFYANETNEYNGDECDQPYGPVTFTTSNGHTAMQLRANYNELWLTPGQTLQLTPEMAYTDNVVLPFSAASTTFSSASTSVVTVDGNGNVFAAGLGDTSIKLTSGSLTDTVLVHVNTVNDTPNFGNNGSELTSYVPGESMFVRSMFFSLVSNLSQYVSAFQAAQVNTLESGFYPPPSVTAPVSATTSAAWESDFNSYGVPNITAAAADGFNIILTGDNIARGGPAAYNAAYGPSAAWSPNPITYAMTWAKSLGKIIGIEMVDEITSQYFAPFPQGQLGAPGGPQSIVCVNNSCTVNWPAPYTIGNGANVMYISGATSNPNLNSLPDSNGYTETGSVTGSAYWNGFTFTATGVGTQTFTAATDPNLVISAFATNGSNVVVPDNTIQKIMSYADAAPGGPPNITWPAAADTSGENFGAWANSAASDYNDIYMTYLGNSYPDSYGIGDALSAFNYAWNNKYPYAQKNKPTLFEVGDVGVGYVIQGTPISISSFDGNTMTFSQPDGITNLMVGTTRLSVTGDSNSALNGNYYVYNIVNPTTVQVYSASPTGPTVSSPAIVVTFYDGQQVTLTFPNSANVTPTGINMLGGPYCLNQDNFGQVATVASTTNAAYNGEWYVFPSTAYGYNPSNFTTKGNALCTWGIQMVPLTSGQSGSGGTASLITDNYYHAGTDPVLSPGTPADNVAANVMYGAEKGAAGERVYEFGGDDNADAQANGLFTPSNGGQEQEANPLYNGPGAIAIWQGLSNGFNLVHDIEPYLLQPKLNSPDYGPMIITGARTSSYGDLLMMTNYSQEPNLVVPVNLAPYNANGGTGTMYTMSGEELTQSSISGTSTNINFAPGETVAFTFPAANQVAPTPPSSPTSTPPDTTPPTASITLPLASTTISGSASPVTVSATDNVGVTKVGLYVDGVLEGTDTVAPYTFTLNTLGLTNATHILSAKAYDAAGNIGTSVNVSVTVYNPTSTPSGFAITSAVISNITQTSAQLTVTLSSPASVVVRYGPTTAYGDATIASPDLSNVFESLTGLLPNTVYDFMVTAIPEGTTTQISSANAIFTTASASQGPAPSSGGGGGSSGGGGGGYSGGGGGNGSTSAPSSTVQQSSTPITASSSPVSGSVSGSTGPVAFPRNLAFGDTGPDVLLLQTTLQNLGYFPPTFTPTTYFGSLTQHALLVFQNAHQLNISGFLDIQSQMLLNKVVAADPSLAGLAQASSTPASTTVPTAPATGFTRNLAPGSTGAEVTLLQQTLFTDGDYPADLVTGYYGSLTEAAVKAFQSKYGIVDYGSPASTGYGAVGPRTRKQLGEL